MHKTIKIALWFLGVLLTVLAGIALYLRSADLSVYEDQIEGLLSNAIGHKVNVEGLFELRVGRITYLTAEDISITNPDWPAESQLLTVEHFSVAVDTLSLVSNPIIVENLDLQSANIIVEKNTDGALNWDSSSTNSSSPASDSADQSSADLNRIAFRHVDVRNVALAYDSDERAEPLTVDISGLTIEPDAAGILDIDLDGNVNNHPLTADGKVGPWRNFLAGKDLSANLDLSLGRIRMSVVGAAEDLQLLQGVESQVTLQGPEIERVIEVFGLPPFATGEFDLEADITKHARGRQFHLVANAGEISVTADGNLDHLASPNLLDVVFDLSGPDAKGVAEVIGIEGVSDAPFQVLGDVQFDRQELTLNEIQTRLGDNSATIDGWLAFNGDVPDADITFSAGGPNLSVVGPFVDVEGIPADTFELNGHIEKNGQNLAFDNVTASIGEIQIGANGKLDRQSGDDTEIFISISGPDISVIEPMTGLKDVPERPFAASAILRPDPVGVDLDDAKLTVGDNNLQVDGIVGTTDKLNGTQVTLHGFGPELQSVRFLAGTPYLPKGEYDYKANVEITGDELSFRNVEISVVGAELSANGTANIGSNIGDFDMSISATSDDVSKLELFESLKPLIGEAMNINGRLSNSAGALALHQVSADIAELEIDVDGSVDSGDGTAVMTLAITAPDSALANELVPAFDLPDGAIDVSGKVARNPNDFFFDHLSVRLGELAASANGTLSNQPMSNASDLEFNLSGPDLQVLGEMFSLRFMPPKSFRVAGEINGTPTGFAIENIDANIGENEIVGRFTADLRDKPDIKGSVSASYLDVAGRMAQLKADEPEEEIAAENSTSPFLLPDDPLPLDFLKSINLDIDVRANRLILSQVDVRDFQLGLMFKDGSLRIEPVSFVESEGAISGHLRLNPTDDNFRLDANFDIDNVHFGLLSEPGQDRTLLPASSGNIDIQGAGNTIHEIMSNSNGSISLTQSAGQMNSAMASRFFGDLVTQILQALNPLATRESHTNMECAYYDVSIVNGLAAIDRIAVQTDKVTMAASGSVNFPDEKLKLSLNAKPRKGFGISVGGIANSFFNVGGTLKKPALGIDTAGTVTTTGAAIATGGLSLIAKGLWDRASSQGSICEETTD